MSATIRVNGEERPLTAATVAALLREEDIEPSARGVAVAINGVVARKADWETTALSAGDKIEIVRPFKGG